MSAPAPKVDAGGSRPPLPLTSPAEPEKTHIVQQLKHTSPLISCRFDPEGRSVFAGSEDQTVQRWDLESGQRTTFQAHESWVFALAFHPDGQTLLTGGGDGRLIWWPATAQAPAPLRTIAAHHGWVRSVAVSADGSQAATCGNDRMVRLWSITDGRLIMELPGHARPVYRLAFDPSGRFLVSADLQGLVIQWDIKTGKEARRIDAGKLYHYNSGQGVDYGGVRDLSFSRDGAYLACSGLVDASNPLGAVSNPAIVLVDWAVGKEKLLQRPKEDVKGVGWGVRFHPAGFLVAVSGGTSGGFLWFWKPDQVHEFFKFNLTNTGRDLDLHRDGLRLATAHYDGQVRICAMRPKSSA
jgi:WD40 repeat protein